MIDPVVASRIRLLGLDVDGVLTDNAVYIGEMNGERVEFKRFDIQDGLGLTILKQTGMPVIWLSGRESPATKLRAAELRPDELIQVGNAAKLPVMQELLDRRGIVWADVAFVADDLADVPLLRRVGLPIAVANAVPEVKQCASYITRAAGGAGAVREAVEAILRARGAWPGEVKRYLRDRGDDAA